MSTGKKITLWLLVSPFLLFFIFSIIWDANWFKEQAEPHLEDVEGHSIDFATIEHSLYSPGYAEVQDITLKGVIGNGKIGTLIIDMDVFDALNKDIYIKQITLKDTDLTIDMQAFNLWLENQSEDEVDIQSGDESTENSGSTDEPFPLNSIYINKLSLENVNVRDSSELNQFLVSGLSLILKDLNIAQDAQIIIGDDNYPISAQLNIPQLRAMSAPPAELQLNVTATQSLINIDTLTLSTEKSKVDVRAEIKNPNSDAEINLILNDSNIFIDEFKGLITQLLEGSELPVEATGELKLEGKLSAQGRLADPQSLMHALAGDAVMILDTHNSFMDIKGEIESVDGQADVTLQINDSQLDFDEFQGLLTEIPVKPTGVIQINALLDANGQVNEPDVMLATLAGKVQLAMDQGRLDGVDINELVAGFKDSKETDLKDVGSFLLTGPVGILAANLIDIGAGAVQFEGETLISQLRINGDIDNGNINVNNTAIATDEFRLAFDGAINPVKGTFEEFTFAILDEAGCADIKQTLNGKISSPTSVIAKNILDSAIAPITGLIDTVKNAAVDCEPFYQGEVAAPQ